jgi:curved DNA-binding protein CbpA
MAFDRDAYEVLQVQPKAHQLVLQAAYRVLASLYHPDRDSSAASNRKMAELNDAYAKVRTRDLREVYDKARERRPAGSPAAVVTPYAPQRARPPTEGRAGSGELDFGRYAGWTVSQIAPHDPDYLRWLARHSSGIRYRAEIERVLRDPAPPPELRRRR